MVADLNEGTGCDGLAAVDPGLGSCSKSRTTSLNSAGRATASESGGRRRAKGLRGRHWHVVRTRSQSENLAIAALKSEGFDLFFPRVHKPRPRSRFSYVPLFPGYLFVQCRRDGHGWPSLSRIPGVFGWLHFGGTVPSVPDGVISDLAQKVEDINNQGGLWNRYKPGEKVCVVYGGTESLAEVVEEAKSPQARVRVLLEFMGRRVSAQVPYENLQPALPDELAVSEKERRHRRTRGKGRWIRGFGSGADDGHAEHPQLALQRARSS